MCFKERPGQEGAPMLDRVLKAVITLTLLLFLLQAVVGVLSRVILAALAGAVAVVGHAGSFLGSMLVGVAMACFVVGLGVRLVRFLATRDPSAARERASRERAMRQRVRRPAEGVPPVNNQREHLADPDPAVGADDEVR
jgi:uncharacterized membrane protein